MLIVALVTFGGAVVGLAAPAAIDRIPAGRLRSPHELTRARGPLRFAIVAAVAGTWAFLATAIGPESELPAYLYLGWIGVVLTVIDIRHHRLPDLLVLPSYPIALALLGTAALAANDYDPLARALAGGAVLAAFYYAIAFLAPGGIGFGDVKLGGFVGLYLGWIGWSALVLGTVLAFVCAAVAAAILIGAGRAGRSSRIPFGPYILGSTLVSIACSTTSSPWL